MKKFQKILKTLSILMVVGLMLVPASATFASGTDRPLTDRENAAFIVRDEWSAWVKGFTASLSELDKNATSRIYNNMDYYDMQYRFTEKYKKVPEYLDEDGKPTQKLKDLIKEKRKELAGAQTRDYLCFTSKQNGSTIKYTLEGGLASSRVNIGYSKDGTSFVPWTPNTPITLNSGEELYVRNKTSLLSENDTNYVKFAMTGNLEGSGSVDSMINFADISDYCYAHLFDGCTALYTAPEVPSTSVRSHCYYKMFYGCTNLSTAPSSLPAATLALSCYESMFENCTSLKKSPNMMPKTIVDVTNALQRMFYGCSVLEEIDIASYAGNFNAAFTNWVNGVASSGTIYYEGPDTTVGQSAIPTGWLVFSLTKDYLTFTADEGAVDIFYTLNGTVNVDNLYYYKSGDNKWTKWTASVSLNQGESMKVWNNSSSAMTTSSSNYFQFTTSARVKCSGNVNSMKNFNDTLTFHCYNSLFRSTKITTAPTLPSTTIYNYCYARMFESCSQLVTPPELPATVIETGAYNAMFYNCKNLTSVPNGLRNVTNVSSSACYRMFASCESLVSVPVDLLPAQQVGNESYGGMFRDCKKLKNAPNLPAETIDTNCYSYMFDNCYDLETVPEILPTQTMSNYCYAYMFRNCNKITKSPRIAATTLATSCFKEMFRGCTLLKEITVDYAGNIEGDSFTDWVSGVADEGIFYYSGTYRTYGSSNIPKADADGQRWAVFAPGEALVFTSQQNGSTIYFNEWNATGAETPTTTGTNASCNGIYYKKNNGAWTHWNRGDINKITLNNRDKLLVRNTNNSLSRTVPMEGVYSVRFKMEGSIAASGNVMAMLNHSSLYTAALYGLFNGCAALTSAPELPATTLAQGCYRSMFYGCTGLTAAPRLPATTLAADCYQFMFYGCTNLREIKLDYTGGFAGGQFDNWVVDVANTGTFYYNGSSTSSFGPNAIPKADADGQRWTVQTFTP